MRLIEDRPPRRELTAKRESSSESAQRVGLGWCQERALNRRFSAVTGTFPSKVWQETGVGIWSLMRDMEQGFNIAN